MAIKPGYKTFTFDGQNSGTYGVYITGSAVYNAPERDVEMIKIPGRNGAFVQDNGRFENIEVTYPAGIYADSQEDFAKALSDLRNMLASRKGYCRLTDEYNPEEYRMAVYKSGLDVDPVAFQRAGEFQITFECKPQRWLTSGEVATAVANGGKVSNPTLFESGPLLAIKGYGTIEFNGYQIELENAMLGHVLIENGKSNISITGASYGIPFTENVLNAADTITLGASKIKWGFAAMSGAYIATIKIDSNTGISGSSASNGPGVVTVRLPDLTFAKGTASSYTNTTGVRGSRNGGGAYTAQLVLNIAYDGSNTITFSFTDTYSSAEIERTGMRLEYGDITGESTISQLGNPSYIDCDLGDAYRIESGEYISMNQNVDLGSDLPKFAPGDNTVTFDNTITELKIEPRWWKV